MRPLRVIIGRRGPWCRTVVNRLDSIIVLTALPGQSGRERRFRRLLQSASSVILCSFFAHVIFSTILVKSLTNNRILGLFGAGFGGKPLLRGVLVGFG